MSVAIIYGKLVFAIANVGFCTYCALGHYIEANIEPSWKMSSTHLGKIHSRDCTEFDA